MLTTGLVMIGLAMTQAAPPAPEMEPPPVAEAAEPPPGEPKAEAPLIPAFFTAETLYDICTRPNAGQCSMYVAGTLDGVFFMNAARESKSFCLPATTNRKMADAVVGYLETHPEIREKAAAAVIHQAVAEMYPCAPEEPADAKDAVTPLD